MSAEAQELALDWPQQDHSQHPFDADTTADRHERTHRQSSQDATVTGLAGWMKFRAANYRTAAASWAGEAAHLRSAGAPAEAVAAADFHAQRFARQAEVYGRRSA